MILAEVQQGNSNRVTESIRATDGLHGDDGTPVERMREANVRTALGGSARDGMVAGDQGAAQSTLEKIGLGSFTVPAAEPEQKQQKQVECFSGQSMLNLVEKRVGQAAEGGVLGPMVAGAAWGTVIGGPAGTLYGAIWGTIAGGMLDVTGIPMAIGAAEGYLEGKIRNTLSSACSNTNAMPDVWSAKQKESPVG